MVPDYTPEDDKSPVNLTTYDRIESLPLQDSARDTELNRSMSGKKQRANRKMRATRAKSRNYSRYSEGRSDKDGYEVDLEEIKAQHKVVYEVHGEETEQRVIRELNEGAGKI